jgi:hypothetical protein
VKLDRSCRQEAGKAILGRCCGGGGGDGGVGLNRVLHGRLISTYSRLIVGKGIRGYAVSKSLSRTMDG